MNPTTQNPNDFKVVSFHNSNDFGFTPEMGCMYNGIAINGKAGSPGIDAGETVVLPFHVAHQLALNLAKASMLRKAPVTDPAGIPTGVPLWDETQLLARKNSYLTELYSEEKAAPKSEVELLMQKMDEYKRMTDEKFSELANRPVVTGTVQPSDKITYQDKAEVLAELEKRGIKHDKRQNKETLEKLLVA